MILLMLIVVLVCVAIVLGIKINNILNNTDIDIISYKLENNDENLDEKYIKVTNVRGSVQRKK